MQQQSEALLTPDCQSLEASLTTLPDRHYAISLPLGRMELASSVASNPRSWPSTTLPASDQWSRDPTDGSVHESDEKVLWWKRRAGIAALPSLRRGQTGLGDYVPYLAAWQIFQVRSGLQAGRATRC